GRLAVGPIRTPAHPDRLLRAVRRRGAGLPRLGLEPGAARPADAALRDRGLLGITRAAGIPRGSRRRAAAGRRLQRVLHRRLRDRRSLGVCDRPDRAARGLPGCIYRHGCLLPGGRVPRLAGSRASAGGGAGELAQPWIGGGAASVHAALSRAYPARELPVAASRTSRMDSSWPPTSS